MEELPPVGRRDLSPPFASAGRGLPALPITGGFTSIFSGAMPFATRRDFMNSEMTTSFLNLAIAAIRRF